MVTVDAPARARPVRVPAGAHDPRGCRGSDTGTSRTGCGVTPRAMRAAPGSVDRPRRRVSLGRAPAARSTGSVSPRYRVASRRLARPASHGGVDEADRSPRDCESGRRDQRGSRCGGDLETVDGGRGLRCGRRLGRSSLAAAIASSARPAPVSAGNSQNQSVEAWRSQ